MSSDQGCTAGVHGHRSSPLRSIRPPLRRHFGYHFSCRSVIQVSGRTPSAHRCQLQLLRRNDLTPGNGSRTSGPPARTAAPSSSSAWIRPQSVTSRELVILEGDIPSPVNAPKGCKFHTRCKYATEICSHVEPPLEEITPNHFVACHHRLETSCEAEYLSQQAQQTV